MFGGNIFGCDDVVCCGYVSTYDWTVLRLIRLQSFLDELLGIQIRVCVLLWINTRGLLLFLLCTCYRLGDPNVLVVSARNLYIFGHVGQAFSSRLPSPVVTQGPALTAAITKDGTTAYWEHKLYTRSRQGAR